MCRSARFCRTTFQSFFGERRVDAAFDDLRAGLLRFFEPSPPSLASFGRIAGGDDRRQIPPRQNRIGAKKRVEIVFGRARMIDMRRRFVYDFFESGGAVIIGEGGEGGLHRFALQAAAMDDAAVSRAGMRAHGVFVGDDRGRKNARDFAVAAFDPRRTIAKFFAVIRKKLARMQKIGVPRARDKVVPARRLVRAAAERGDFHSSRTSSMRYIGRLRAASRIRHKYSPMMPSIVITIPEKKVKSTTIVAQPGGWLIGYHPVALPTNT